MFANVLQPVRRYVLFFGGVAIVLAAVLVVSPQRAAAIDSAHMACPHILNQVPDGGAVADVLDVPGDFDCFVFEANAGWTYHINVDLGVTPGATCVHWSGCTGAALPDSYLMLSSVDMSFPFQSPENAIKVDDDGGPGYASYIEFTPETSGRYYIYVRGYSATADSGTFTVRLHSTVTYYDPCQYSWWLPGCWSWGSN